MLHPEADIAGSAGGSAAGTGFGPSAGSEDGVISSGMKARLSFCRQCLIEIAGKELQSDAREASLLADTAMLEVRERIAQLSGHSATELRAWLRELLFDEPGPLYAKGGRVRPTLLRPARHDPLDRTVFRQALTRLPSELFQAIDLRHRLHTSTNDMARSLGLAIPAARKLYIRALAALAQELAEATAKQGECRPIPPLWEEACRQVIALGPAALKMGPPDLEQGLFPYFENVLRCLKWMAAYWPLPPERIPAQRGRLGSGINPDTHFPRIDGFQIAESIGGGGQGVVYRAWHKRLECWVALKLLDMAGTCDPEHLRCLRQEARIAAGITENGILPIRDVIDLGSKLVLVMPYVEGHNLAQIANQRWKVLRGHPQKEEPHPWASLDQRDYTERVLLLFDKVLEALFRLHRRGVLHGDLKPANILVDKNEECWLIDFGLASQRYAESSTYPALAGGTQGFMGPEQWSGAKDIDERADIFGIGATIYQTLTLELPYGMSRLFADQVPVQLRPEQKRFLPRFMDLVIQKTLHPDRSRRYQNIDDLREDWKRVHNGRLPSAGRTGQIFRLVYSLGRFL